MIAESEWVIQEPCSQKGKWTKVFGNDHSIRIEIGMGKGKFLHELAKENPEINYIGIEKYSSVIDLRILLRQFMKEFSLSHTNLYAD